MGQLIREDGLIEKKGLVGLLHYYSQTGRSFAGNFANFHRNTGILIDNLLGAICNHWVQFVNQNTNAAAEVCKVARKRTSGLTVKQSTDYSFQYDSIHIYMHKNTQTFIL